MRLPCVMGDQGHRVMFDSRALLRLAGTAIQLYCACETDDILKSATRNAGVRVRVNQSAHSRDNERSTRDAATPCRSTSNGDMLNRKLITAPTISPPSTR